MDATGRAGLMAAFLAYMPMMRRLARKFLRDRTDEADDVMQIAWLRAERGWPPREMRYVGTWLGRIVINEALKRDRSRRIERGRRADADEPDAVTALALADVGLDAESACLANERSARLVEACARLPERFRAVILLRYGADLTIEETAERLGIAIGTVKSTCHKATARLRKTLLPEAA